MTLIKNSILPPNSVVQARVPQASGPKAVVRGFAKGSVSGGRDGCWLFSAFTWQIQCLISGLGSTRYGFFYPDRGTDTAAIWFWGIRCCKCQCNATGVWRSWEKLVSYRVYSTQTSHYSSILNKERRLQRDAEGGRDARELSLPWSISIR